MKMNNIEEDFDNGVNQEELERKDISDAENKMLALMNQMQSEASQPIPQDQPIPQQNVEKNTNTNIGMNIVPERDVNYWDIDNLPTKYRLYPDGTKLSARPLKVLDVKKLTSINDENADSIVNDIIRKCVRGVDVKDIYSADKMYILLWLRANSFRDNKYIVKYGCPKCEQESAYHFTIDKVNVDYIPDDYDPDKIIELSKDKVTIKLLQIKDELSIASFETKYGNIYANHGDGVDEELLALSYMIGTVNGEALDDVARYNYLLEMSPEDFSTLTTYLNEVSVGVKSYMNVSCDKCGGESPVGITFHPDFFLPKLRTK